MAEQIIERPSVTQGNIAPIKATLTRDNEAFPVADADNVAIALVSGLGRKTVIAPEDYEISMVEEGVIYVDGPATLAPGCYGLEVKGTLNGTPWRTYTPSALVVTYPTVVGGGTATATGDRIDITMNVQMYAMSMRTMEGIQQAIDECEAAADSANDAAQTANAAAQGANGAAQGADEAKQAVEATEQQVATAEAARVLAEQGRVNAEAGRAQAEESRVGAEQGRVTAELARGQAEQGRAQAEQARQADFSAKMEQADVAIEKGEHPDYVGEDNYIYRYNMTLHQYVRTNIYVKGGKGDKGDPGKDFSIYKTYASISAMNADKDNVPLTEFVLIASTVEDPDNAKLFVRSNDATSGFVYLTDLSGAQGIKGDRGYSSYEIAVQHGYTGSEAEYNALYFDAVSAANAAAGLANEKAVLAATAAANADAKATLANDAATLANAKAGLADTAATEASRVNASVSGTVISVTNRLGQTSQADVGFALVKNISVDYRLNADTVQWTNLYGAIKITRLAGVNVSSVKLSYGSVIEQVVSLGTVDIDIADGDVVTMKIVRTSELQEASVSVRLEQAQGSSSE